MVIGQSAPIECGSIPFSRLYQIGQTDILIQKEDKCGPDERFHGRFPRFEIIFLLLPAVCIPAVSKRTAL
jgi:hypothetical protein